jgi:ribosome maturation factor RimP
MNPMAKKVVGLVQPAINDMGYELLGVEYGDQGRGALLRIYIDHDQGITLDDCVTVSRQVSALLDVEDLIAGHYDLEVSSPGLDRPLFNEEQLGRYISHQVKIVMAVPQLGRKRFTGELKNVSDGMIELEVDNEIYDLPFAEVASARLVPEI